MTVYRYIRVSTDSHLVLRYSHFKKLDNFNRMEKKYNFNMRKVIYICTIITTVNLTSNIYANNTVSYACPLIKDIKYNTELSEFYATSHWNNQFVSWNQYPFDLEVLPKVISFYGLSFDDCDMGNCIPRCIYNTNIKDKYLALYPNNIESEHFMEIENKMPDICKSNDVNKCRFELIFKD